MIPGEIALRRRRYRHQRGRRRLALDVVNTGDRPVQVGSHVHLPQANGALEFDRDAAHGHRLDIPAGTAVRFEPGVAQHVSLVPLTRRPRGARAEPEPAGPIGRVVTRAVAGALRRAVRTHHRRPDPAGRHRPVRRDHRGPQRRPGTGRRRGGLRRRQGAARVDGAGPRDPGRRRTGHGHHRCRDHRLLGNHQGRHRYSRRPHRRDRQGGQPRHMSGVHPDLVVGPSTEIIAGNGRIVTAGAIDCHVHLICPQIMEEALGGGITTDRRGRHRARRGQQGHHRHARRMASGAHARGAGHLAAERRAARQGQHRQRRSDVGATARWRSGFQAARGLGDHPGRDRRLPEGRRRSPASR